MIKQFAKRGVNKHDSHIVFIFEIDDNNRKHFVEDYVCGSINAAKRLVREWNAAYDARMYWMASA